MQRQEIEWLKRGCKCIYINDKIRRYRKFPQDHSLLSGHNCLENSVRKGWFLLHSLAPGTQKHLKNIRDQGHSDPMEFHGSQDLGLWRQITLSCCGKVCLPLVFAKTLFFSSWLPFLFGEKVNLNLPAYPSVLTENTNSKTFPVVDHVTSRESEVIQKTFAIKKLMSLLMF